MNKNHEYDNFHKFNNPYKGGKIPPCSAFLNDKNPIIKNGKLIYRNLNRIYCFLSTAEKIIASDISTESNTSNLLRYTPITSTNLQISLATFIIGLFINQIQLGVINYNKDCVIHSDETANMFIHQTLQKPPEITMNYIPKLAFLYSNGDAILPLISSTINITPLNYYILFVLNRLENNPGLFFGNNSFITKNPINFDLASLNLQFPL